MIYYLHIIYIVTTYGVSTTRVLARLVSLNPFQVHQTPFQNQSHQIYDLDLGLGLIAL